MAPREAGKKNTMKPHPPSVGYLMLSAMAGILTLDVVAAPVVLQSGPHHTVWQDVSAGMDGTGQPVWVTNSWTELATGLNYWEPLLKQWAPAVEAFDLTPKGYAVATRGQYQVILAPDIAKEGAVDLQMADGVRLQSNPTWLSYFSPKTGKTVMLAQVTNAVGELVAVNTLLYPRAFDTFDAGICYTYRKSGFSQDILVFENPGPPSAWGLDDPYQLAANDPVAAIDPVGQRPGFGEGPGFGEPWEMFLYGIFGRPFDTLAVSSDFVDKAKSSAQQPETLLMLDLRHHISCGKSGVRPIFGDYGGGGCRYRLDLHWRLAGSPLWGMFLDMRRRYSTELLL
jgi:hypothetical protein